MQHAEAEESHSVERYLMNEMSDDERESFEEHYFDCQLCAEDVTEGERMMASGHVVALEAQNVVPFRSRAMRWAAQAAAAIAFMILGGVLASQRMVPVVELMDESDRQNVLIGVARSGQGDEIRLRAGVMSSLSIEIETHEHQYPRYAVRIDGSGGRQVFEQLVPLERARDGVTLLLRSLPAGSYVLTIRGVPVEGNRTVIATHPVRVQ